MKNRIVIFVVFVCCLWTMPGIVRAQLSVHQFDQIMKKIDDVYNHIVKDDSDKK